MKRPFKDKRPVGPFVGSSFSDSGNAGVLMARRQGNPEVRIDIAEVSTDIDEEIFQTFNRRAKFEAQDIIVAREEGQVGTTEPAVTTIKIIAEDEEVSLEDIKHITSVMEKEFTVFETNISGSVGIDPDRVSNPLEGAELIEEPTELDK